jgi:predicted Rossmann fold flavoprotein
LNTSVQNDSAPGKRVIVIGGGAAGFFAAINLAIKHPDYKIELLEKSGKLLSKVKISGGGRCNVTHACFDKHELVKNYPRGQRELVQVFSHFNTNDTIQWFQQQGIQLHTEADGRMFPVSNSSQTIIDCFLHLAEKHHIRIQKNTEVLHISPQAEGFELKTTAGVINANAVVCAIGGHPKSGFYDVLRRLGHSIQEPLPSLFTLNFPQEKITKELMGLSVQDAEVRIKGSKLNYHGPVLITHWGLSGPAVLKLSAFAAKEFYEKNYRSEISVNWVYPLKTHEVEAELKQIRLSKNKSYPLSQSQFNLPKRLWEYLCDKAGINQQKPWAELSSKQLQALAQALNASTFNMEGRTTFKEEFVTCGGVNLKEVDFKTMQSKKVPGLFFCGEVLDIDGITGGFNFQSAWSTAWICSENC